MSLDAAQKAEIIKEFQTSERDTGSPEVQVALLTSRIEQDRKSTRLNSSHTS